MLAFYFFVLFSLVNFDYVLVTYFTHVFYCHVDIQYVAH